MISLSSGPGMGSIVQTGASQQYRQPSVSEGPGVCRVAGDTETTVPACSSVSFTSMCNSVPFNDRQSIQV